MKMPDLRELVLSIKNTLALILHFCELESMSMVGTVFNIFLLAARYITLIHSTIINQNPLC